MSSPVRRLIDARRVSSWIASSGSSTSGPGEGAATRSLEVRLLENELGF